MGSRAPIRSTIILALSLAVSLVASGCEVRKEASPQTSSARVAHTQESARPRLEPSRAETSPSSATPAPAPTSTQKEPASTYEEVDRIISRELSVDVMRLPTSHPYYQAELGRTVELLRDVDHVFEADHHGRTIEVTITGDPHSPHHFHIGSLRPISGGAARQLRNPPKDLDGRNAKLMEMILEHKNKHDHVLSMELVQPR